MNKLLHDLNRLERDCISKKQFDQSKLVGEASEEIKLLLKSLHDAINTPKGIVPASADCFYSPEKYYSKND